MLPLSIHIFALLGSEEFAYETRAERNWQATRGLRNRRYRGVKDTSWPVGDQARARWLNDPDFDSY